MKAKLSAVPTESGSLSPEELAHLETVGPLPLTLGDDRASYERLAAAIVAEIHPTDILEWMYVRDMVDNQWRLTRYRGAEAVVMKAEEVDVRTNFLASIDEVLGRRKISAEEKQILSDARAIKLAIGPLCSLNSMIATKESHRDYAHHHIERRRKARGSKKNVSSDQPIEGAGLDEVADQGLTQQKRAA